MLLTTPKEITQNDTSKVENFFKDYENLDNITTEEVKESNVCKYISSLVTNCYAKSVEEIANTKVGNRITRKRNFQQVMQESFFYGSNRFGNNFIA